MKEKMNSWHAEEFIPYVTDENLKKIRQLSRLRSTYPKKFRVAIIEELTKSLFEIKSPAAHKMAVKLLESMPKDSLTANTEALILKLKNDFTFRNGKQTAIGSIAVNNLKIRGLSHKPEEIVSPLKYYSEGDIRKPPTAKLILKHLTLATTSRCFVAYRQESLNRKIGDNHYAQAMRSKPGKNLDAELYNLVEIVNNSAYEPVKFAESELRFFVPFIDEVPATQLARYYLDLRARISPSEELPDEQLEFAMLKMEEIIKQMCWPKMVYTQGEHRIKAEALEMRVAKSRIRFDTHFDSVRREMAKVAEIDLR